MKAFLFTGPTRRFADLRDVPPGIQPDVAPVWCYESVAEIEDVVVVTDPPQSDRFFQLEDPGRGAAPRFVEISREQAIVGTSVGGR